MSQEKKHKEDLEAAKGWYTIAKENDNKLGIQILEDLFPELRESEDERIRKRLVEIAKVWKSGGYACGNDDEIDDIISWLEKQGEQNTANFEEAEKEKSDFVSGQFIECRKSFNEFEEEKSYWLEYIGDDTYIGRSDNVLNHKFHITPRQIFTLFTHEHCPKENNDEQKEINTNWEDKIKGLNKLEEYILSLDPNRSLDAVKVDAKNIRFLVNEEQKPADKVEPKFKVGDWIINNDKRIAVPEQILKIEKYGYLTSMGYTSFNKVKTDYHLWTIQDAKDGDVLVNGSNIFIFSHISNTRAMGYCHINLDDERFYDDKGKNECFGLIDTIFTPATKEQCNRLFSKMKEAGYEWDDEQHRKWILEYLYDGLRKSDEQFKDQFKSAITWLEKQDEQKPSWSEKDEKISDAIYESIDFLCLESFELSEDEVCDWLKSLKDRVQNG